MTRIAEWRWGNRPFTSPTELLDGLAQTMDDLKNKPQLFPQVAIKLMIAFPEVGVHTALNLVREWASDPLEEATK